MNREQTAALGLDPLLTTSELADYLGVNVQAIYDLRYDGRAPVAIHVGRELRYRVSDVVLWLSSMEDAGPVSTVAKVGGEI